MYLQLPCLCEFPSREFYDGKLKTSRGVVRRYSNETYHLRNFWPNNDMQFIFCNVVGKEEDHYNTGRDGATAFGIESKINNEEAKKIVSLAKEFEFRNHCNKLPTDIIIYWHTNAGISSYSIAQSPLLVVFELYIKLIVLAKYGSIILLYVWFYA